MNSPKPNVPQVTPTQQRIIDLIRETRKKHRACTVGEIARILKLHRTHINIEVRKLRDLGIVTYNPKITGSLAMKDEDDYPRKPLVVGTDPRFEGKVMVFERLSTGQPRLVGEFAEPIDMTPPPPPPPPKKKVDADKLAELTATVTGGNHVEPKAKVKKPMSAAQAANLAKGQAAMRAKREAKAAAE